MNKLSRVSRREFLHGASLTAMSCLLPAWAKGQIAATPANRFALEIGEMPISIEGHDAIATGINGTVPGPLLRFREGERVRLDVTNRLTEDSSIHWHGLLLPSDMDGVPGLSFGGIGPGETYHYEFDLVQNGTYWYHSHSGLQEQTGVYGPMIIDPAGPDPVDYDIEYVLMLSDWTFEDPWKLYAKLKKQDDYYNRQRRTMADLFADAKEDGWKATLADRWMWGGMRMAASDIADVTGATYTHLLNGLGPDTNWTGLFEPGQKIRLRIINGSAMSFYNVRIPGLPMTVVQTDGQHVAPVTVDELQIGVAETYDVVVQPESDAAFTFFAESMDRSGYARGTLAPRQGMIADIPPLRERPLLTMADMGMNHDAMDHGGMDHSMHGGMSMPAPVTHDHPRGPGVANITETPADRLAEPGIGLDNQPHRVLTYADLRNLTELEDQREPARELELHLTGNMERYMWSFDGVKYSHVDGPIVFEYGERLRMVLVNDTMMSHPIHLHGMFVELDNGNGAFNPRKHTVVVKPAERLTVNLTADAPGRWAFHCHMIYHMKGGMMREVRVVDDAGAVT